jgi:hypothetical protein
VVVEVPLLLLRVVAVLPPLLRRRRRRRKRRRRNLTRTWVSVSSIRELTAENFAKPDPNFIAYVVFSHMRHIGGKCAR